MIRSYKVTLKTQNDYTPIRSNEWSYYAKLTGELLYLTLDLVRHSSRRDYFASRVSFDTTKSMMNELWMKINEDLIFEWIF